MREEDFKVLRREMLAEISACTAQLRDTLGKAALDERVMTALDKVPRHEFVPVELQPYAYANIPLPIGFEKTISQPFIVGLMTDLLDLSDNDAVLEVGTGLGYQAAILAQLAQKVYSMEIIDELGQEAKRRLERQGCYQNKVRIANSFSGWSETAEVVQGWVRARTVRQADGHGSPVSHSSAADPSIEEGRENGHSSRSTRCAAAHSAGKARRRPSDDERDPRRALLATRGQRSRRVGSAK